MVNFILELVLSVITMLCSFYHLENTSQAIAATFEIELFLKTIIR